MHDLGFFENDLQSGFASAFVSVDVAISIGRCELERS
jgi:hypothetical protein